MTQFRFGLFACIAPLTLLAANLALAQQAGTGQNEHQHDQSIPMDPSMQMKAPATGKPIQTHQENPSNKPITEPTVAPAESGEAMHMHMHHIEHVMPHLPEIGRSKNPGSEKGPVYTLEDLEQRALSHNPTLSQAKHDIEAAQGIRRQVGLYPNPTIGYYGDEIRGGAYRSGKQGFFVDQPIITGGKLGLNRKIEDQSIHQMEAASEAQRYRVRNATREAYYRVLTAQELLNIKRDLANIAHSTSEYTHELGNSGHADETEVLQTDVAEQQMLIAVGVQENMLHRAWIALASVVGEGKLPIGTVQGDIESLPSKPDEAKLLDELLTRSPAVQYTQASVAKAEAALKRARRDPVPDITAKGGVSQDNEPLTTPQSRTGLVGFAEIGLQIHLFDRNQGNVDADRANLERDRQELSRIELSLRDRLAAVTDDYRNAQLIASRYRAEILPRTQRAYVLITQQYGLMDASFSRVLNLQRELYQSEVEYLQALENAQTSYVLLDGFLYSGGLDAAGMADPSISASSPVMSADGPTRSTMMPRGLSAPSAQSSLFNSGLQP